jgi:hypothetical protein
MFSILGAYYFLQWEITAPFSKRRRIIEIGSTALPKKQCTYVSVGERSTSYSSFSLKVSRRSAVLSEKLETASVISKP